MTSLQRLRKLLRELTYSEMIELSIALRDRLLPEEDAYVISDALDDYAFTEGEDGKEVN